MKRILLGLVLLVAIAGLVFTAIVWRPSLPPVISPTPTAFAAPLIAKGEMLAGAGNCASCHTVKGGPEYAGGVGLESGFGIIYSTNITPDIKTGIGAWSEKAFARAMHDGVARDGSHLFPAFPYTHFTRVSDEDVKALYAYFMSRTPVQAPEKASTLPFPLNIRALQAGWKLLFFDKGEYQPVKGRSEEWNRGAYLASGLGHCSACHTPRNALGAEKPDATYAGAITNGWLAPALNASSPAPLPWTQDDLFAYLRTGASVNHGVAAGSMSDVVHHGLAKLPDSDVRALAVYFAKLNGSAKQLASAGAGLAKAMARSREAIAHEADPGAQLYLAACASCHYNGAAQPLPMRPELALSSTVTGPEPVNFIRIVLDGIGNRDGLPGAYMPGFAHGFSDEDIAAVAAYVRRTRTDQPDWKNVHPTVTALRQAAVGSP